MDAVPELTFWMTRCFVFLNVLQAMFWKAEVATVDAHHQRSTIHSITLVKADVFLHKSRMWSIMLASMFVISVLFTIWFTMNVLIIAQ